jgi:hypothetical protein
LYFLLIIERVISQETLIVARILSNQSIFNIHAFLEVFQGYNVARVKVGHFWDK